MDNIDVEKRREWLRALRRFKYGMRARAKLGVLQAYCEQVEAQRKRTPQKWDAPQWEHDSWVNLLYVSMRDNEFPPVLIIGFVKTAQITFFSPTTQPTAEQVLHAVNDVCRTLSRDLRIKFGVFIQEINE